MMTMTVRMVLASAVRKRKTLWEVKGAKTTYARARMRWARDTTMFIWYLLKRVIPTQTFACLLSRFSLFL
jgi:hypothetical protein